MPVESISASAIALLIQCPEQYRLRKIKKIPETMGVDRFVGIVDHAVHGENFSQKIYTATDLDTRAMEAQYTVKWDSTIADEGAPVWESPIEETYDLGLRMMQLYHEVASPDIQPVRVEERFEQKSKGWPVPLVGYPDIETKDCIIERKTTSQKVSKPKSKWVVQGRIYSLVLDKPVRYDVVTKQKTPQVVTAADSPELMIDKRHYDSTANMVAQALTTLDDYWVRYGPDNPWPTHGLYHDWLCGYCAFGPRYGNNCVAWR